MIGFSRKTMGGSSSEDHSV
ncbi:hypothetical protein ADUPG1_008260 [Aduncisulcus paluster]|uniref:Uncharacterized protein n=1 Tax=Aduncisulcus paluster TaxID=2918883 RepID=A0ABQ5KRB6_9EUKA|nr:hypothetical protein ADUPG1_008260 [Aduncisulcus paluster]